MARLKFMNTEIDNLTMQETLQAIDSIIQEYWKRNPITYRLSTGGRFFAV